MITKPGSQRRWIGDPVAAPSSERGRLPGGRRRHYASFRMDNTPEEISIDDIVLVRKSCSSIDADTSTPLQLAQVQSMWEDTFTGMYKFKGRWLRHVSKLPPGALARLKRLREPAGGDNVKDASDATDDEQTEEEFVEDEVFLTSETNDLELCMIVNKALVSVGSESEVVCYVQREDGTTVRLTHTYDSTSDDLAPLPSDHPILQHARDKNGRGFWDTGPKPPTGDKSGKDRKDHIDLAHQEWLRSENASVQLNSKGKGKGRGRARSTSGQGRSSNKYQNETDSPRDGSESEEQSDNIRPYREEGALEQISKEMHKQGEGEEVPMSDAAAVNNGRGTLNKVNEQSRTTRCHISVPQAQAGHAPHTAQRRLRGPGLRRPGPLPPRPRRLAMPVAVADVGLEGTDRDTADAGQSTMPNAPEGVPDGQERSGEVSNHVADSSQRHPLNLQGIPYAGKRKRTPSGRMESFVSLSETECQPRLMCIGNDYQAEIPPMLDPRVRSSPGACGARMIWRSASDWDPQSRAMLEDYLRAADMVTKEKQKRSGIAVHVRLGGKRRISGDKSTDDDGQGGSGTYATWAITTDGHGTEREVRVGCSEKMQTEVPRAAIMRVQCEEEALAALVRSRCMLDNFTPALDLLADSPDIPQSLQPWTFEQVRALENALAKEFDPSSHVGGPANSGYELDREDFIDLEKISTMVPGKSHGQVLNFYYKYLACAEPLTDILLGPQAAEAPKPERPSSPNGARDMPSSRWQSGSHHAGYPDERPRQQISPPRARSVNSSSKPEIGDGEVARQEREDGGSDERPSSAASRWMHDPTGSAPAHEKPSTVSRLNVPIGQRPGMTSRREDDNTGSEVPRAVSGNNTSHRDSSTFGRKGFFNRDRYEDRSEDVGGFPRAWSRGGGSPPVVPRTVERRGGYLFTGGELLRQDKEPTKYRGDTCMPPHGREGTFPEDGRNEFERKRFDERMQTAREWSVGSVARRGTEVLEVNDSGREVESREATIGRSWNTPRGTLGERINRRDRDDPCVQPSTSHHQVATRPHGGQAISSRVLGGPSRLSTSSPATDVSHHLQQQQQQPRHAAYQYPKENTGYPNAERWERHEHPYQHHTSQQMSTRPPDNRVTYPSESDHRVVTRENVGSGCTAGAGAGAIPPRIAQDRNGRGPTENSRRRDRVDASIRGEDDAEALFGPMAPCWRLLERAQAYMDVDQLEYMRGLMLTHMDKPMTRNQFLERADSCLRENEDIFIAFFKMYDKIDHSPLVPFYPSDSSSAHVNQSSASSHVSTGGNPDVLTRKEPHGSGSLRVPLPPSLAVEVHASSSQYPSIPPPGPSQGMPITVSSHQGHYGKVRNREYERHPRDAPVAGGRMPPVQARGEGNDRDRRWPLDNRDADHFPPSWRGPPITGLGSLPGPANVGIPAPASAEGMWNHGQRDKYPTGHADSRAPDDTHNVRGPGGAGTIRMLGRTVEEPMRGNVGYPSVRSSAWRSGDAPLSREDGDGLSAAAKRQRCRGARW